jgi:hypothetical protein
LCFVLSVLTGLHYRDKKVVDGVFVRRFWLQWYVSCACDSRTLLPLEVDRGSSSGSAGRDTLALNTIYADHCRRCCYMILAITRGTQPAGGRLQSLASRARPPAKLKPLHVNMLWMAASCGWPSQRSGAAPPGQSENS